MVAAVFRAAALALACAACTSIAVDSRTFEGTYWRVTAIDGEPTPASGDYRVSFENGRISGRFGCNSWSGAFAVTGERITAAQVVSTKMACPEPAGRFEGRGLAVINQPMRWRWASGQELTLASGAGSILLVRQGP